MNRHERLRDQLVDLAHGELSAWSALRLRWHLVRCPACRSEWSTIQGIWGSLRRLSPAASARPHLKGKAMKLRVALAATTVIVTIISGTVVARTRRLHEYNCSVVVQSIKQFWYAEGEARGKLLIYDPTGRLVQTLDVAGKGTTDTVSVGVRRMRDEDNVGPELESFRIKMNERHVLRDATGSVLSSVNLAPFTTAEENEHKKEEQANVTRLLDIYRNPACITLNTARANSGGYAELPGLIFWSMDVLRDQDGTLILTKDHQIVPLENAGLAWKVYGDVQVTMTLLTDKKPVVRRYRSMSRSEAAALVREDPRLAGLFPALGSTPKVLWFQSAAFPADRPLPGDMGTFAGQTNRYWFKPDGTWYETRRSGEFSGYGKHAVRDENGKTLLILEVHPR